MTTTYTAIIAARADANALLMLVSAAASGGVLLVALRLRNPADSPEGHSVGRRSVLSATIALAGLAGLLASAIVTGLGLRGAGPAASPLVAPALRDLFASLRVRPSRCLAAQSDA